jgi:hypothetical protein
MFERGYIWSDAFSGPVIIEAELMPATREVWKVRKQSPDERRLKEQPVKAWWPPTVWWQWLIWFFWGPFPGYWVYTPIEFYVVHEPVMMFDARRNCIYCHPSVANEVRKVGLGGAFG